MPKSSNKKKDEKKKGNENEDKSAKDKSKKNGKGGHENDKELKNQESLVTNTPEITPEELERIEKEKQLEEQRQKELEEERRKAEELIIQITPEDLINERIKALPLDIQLLRYGLSNPGLAPDGKSMVYLKLSLEVPIYFYHLLLLLLLVYLYFFKNEKNNNKKINYIYQKK